MIILNTLLALASFFLAIFPVIVVHEFGHFLVGKWLGAEPKIFSMGIGKRLFSFKWLGADFRLSLLPIGGYVAFNKTQFTNEVGADGNKNILPASKWIPIALAGPVSNFILTFLIFTSVFMYGLSQIDSAKVVSLNPSLPEVTLETKILFLNNENRATDFVRKQILGQTEGKIFLMNNGEISAFKGDLNELNKTFSEKADYSTLNYLGRSVKISAALVVGMGVMTADALVKVVSSKDGYKGLMGPVGIANEANKARNTGMLDFVFLVAGLSFAIGFFNLLPLSFLDGGRVLLASFEVIFKRKVSEVSLGTLNLMSLIVVGGLFFVGMFSDLLRLFQG